LDAVFHAVAGVLWSAKSNELERRQAIYVMWGATNSIAVAGLRHALTFQSRALQLQAAAALLAGDDVSALPIAVDALLQNDTALPSTEIMNLRGAIARGVASPSAVPEVARLLQAKNPSTRLAAVSALGRVESATSLRHLGRALEDSHFDVRYAASGALADATGQKNRRQSAEGFRANEQLVIQYWKNWISKNVGVQ
jgi:HEAT repeat protein